MTRARGLVVIAAGLLIACGRPRHHAAAAPPPVPVAQQSRADQDALYHNARIRIQRDLDELYRHRVYAMSIPFAGYYKIKRWFVRPSAADRAAADLLLNDIIEAATVQIECADAFHDFPRRAAAEDTITRARRTRRMLDLPD